MLATALGKEAALTALAVRREANKNRKRVDDSKLYAGSPMHFDCIGCGDEIVVPEGYITKPSMCPECEAMHVLGWLE